MLSVPMLPAAGFLRLQQVLQLYPVSRSTWWAGVKSGRYPAPIKIGTRCTAWTAESIRELLEQTAHAAKAADEARTAT